MSDASIERLERDGEVAVVYSPGYGAGWYSWNSSHPGLVFDRDIAQAVLDGEREKAAEIAKTKYDPEMYTGGAEQLAVAWVPKGARIEITECDGSERVRVVEITDYLIA